MPGPIIFGRKIVLPLPTFGLGFPTLPRTQHARGEGGLLEAAVVRADVIEQPVPAARCELRRDVAREVREAREVAWVLHRAVLSGLLEPRGGMHASP